MSTNGNTAAHVKFFRSESKSHQMLAELPHHVCLLKPMKKTFALNQVTHYAPKSHHHVKLPVAA